MGGSAIRKMSKHSLKLIAAFVVLGVACVSLWFLYVPGHWLTRVGFGTVTVDDRPAQADLYIGHPAQNQAEAIAFGERYLNHILSASADCGKLGA
jgi:hypothetical protein